MADSRQSDDSLPPHVQLVRLGLAFRVSRIIYAAASLGIADQLAAGPKSAAELAELTGTKPRVLYRFLRSLAGIGLLTEDEDRRFVTTPLGAALRSDAPGAARSTLLVMGSPHFWRAWEHITYCLETGDTGMQREWGKSMFELLAEHPQEASWFSEAMIGIHGSEPPAIAAAYDFSRFETIVDVGGATGNMLAAILDRHAGPRGLLFDLPHVVSDAPALLQSRGLADRIDIEGGDFFEYVPQTGDAYILSHVIHDWCEDQAITILRNCRAAMKQGSTLLVVEMVLPPRNVPHPGKISDMTMLVHAGGEERTADEYAELLSRTGFRLTRVVPTDSAASIIEAVPV